MLSARMHFTHLLERLFYVLAKPLAACEGTLKAHHNFISPVRRQLQTSALLVGFARRNNLPIMVN